MKHRKTHIYHMERLAVHSGLQEVTDHSDKAHIKFHSAFTGIYAIDDLSNHVDKYSTIFYSAFFSTSHERRYQLHHDLATSGSDRF